MKILKCIRIDNGAATILPIFKFSYYLDLLKAIDKHGYLVGISCIKSNGSFWLSYDGIDVKSPLLRINGRRHAVLAGID